MWAINVLPRLRFWRALIWRQGFKLVSLIYGLLSFLDFVRDKVLPVSVQATWDKYYKLPNLGLETWVIIGLSMVLLFVLEGAYREIGRPKDIAKQAGDALQGVYTAGLQLRQTIFASDETLTVEETKSKYMGWRQQLRETVTKYASSGKAQYADGINSVNAGDHIGMKANATYDVKNTLVSHLDARLERLAEILKDC